MNDTEIQTSKEDDASRCHLENSFIIEREKSNEIHYNHTEKERAQQACIGGKNQQAMSASYKNIKTYQSVKIAKSL